MPTTRFLPIPPSPGWTAASSASTPGSAREPDVVDTSSAEGEAIAMAGALRWLHRFDRADDFAEAADTFLDPWREECGGAIGWLFWPRHSYSGQTKLVPLRLLATSSDSSRNPPDGDPAVLIAAAEEVRLRGQIVRWPFPPTQSRHSLLAFRRLACDLRCTNLLAVPMPAWGRDSPGKADGVVIVADVPDTELNGKLAVALPMLSTRLHHFENFQPSPVARLVDRMIDRVGSKSFRGWLLPVLVTLVVAMIPVRHRVACDCELVPVQRRFVASPIDGPLATAEVRPGDTVAAGQVIARVDAREIELRIAAATSELRQADQDLRAARVKQDSHAEQIATLRRDQLRSEFELLHHQASELTIRSPIAGMVIDGDWQSKVGAPVSRGETLFEIAPLDRMIAEVRIREADRASIRSGMIARVRLDAIPGKTWEDRIIRLHPSARVIEDENVFVAEVMIDGDDLRTDATIGPRPGMKGRCRILAGRRPLGWVWGHRPWRALSAWWGV